MSQVIWKFPLDMTDRQPVVMPAGYQLLSVQMQGDRACLWALVDDQAARTTVVISIRGTGHPIAGGAGKYISTFQSGQFVWHAFDMGESQ